jgi:hypothetical protein
MATRNGTITISIDEPNSSDPTIQTESFTYDDSEDMNGSCDITYVSSESEGGPVMRPSKPRF